MAQSSGVILRLPDEGSRRISASRTLQKSPREQAWQEKGASLLRTGKKISASVRKRARQIKVLLMDVDGTLTTGAVTLLSQADGRARATKPLVAQVGRDFHQAR